MSASYRDDMMVKEDVIIRIGAKNDMIYELDILVAVTNKKNVVF